MEFLKYKKIKHHYFLFMILCLLGCAQNYESVLEEPRPIENVTLYGKSELDGSFMKANGESQSLAELNDRPLLIFFVGEFCQACIREMTHLRELVLQKGLSNKVRFVTIMLDGLQSDIEPWFNELPPSNFPNELKWDIGVDTNRELFSLYFRQLTTPSIIYFEPQTRIIKRWQEAIPLSKLEQETQSWH